MLDTTKAVLGVSYTFPQVVCESMFSATVTKYLVLGNVNQQEVYLTHRFGSWKSEIWLHQDSLCHQANTMWHRSTSASERELREGGSWAAGGDSLTLEHTNPVTRTRQALKRTTLEFSEDRIPSDLIIPTGPTSQSPQPHPKTTSPRTKFQCLNFRKEWCKSHSNVNIINILFFPPMFQ